MKLLHTADWHVGRTIRGRSRADEHRAVLTQLVEVAEEEQVDLVLVAGDLFDRSTPSPEAEQIVYRALLELAGVAPVIVVAGNHDHPRRLEAVAPLLDLGRVTVAPLLRRSEDGGVVRLATKAGDEAVIAMIPFLSQRYIVRADELMELDADQHAGRYGARMSQIVDHLTAEMGDDTVNLVVSHLMVAGGEPGGGERYAHIFDYAVPAGIFGGHLHYVALGHLHRTQKMPGSAPIWYSGSPLQLDFGEEQNQPQALIAEAAPGTPGEVKAIPLRGGRRLRTIRGDLETVTELAAEAGEDYLRIVLDEQPRAGLGDEVRRSFPMAVDVRVSQPEEARPGTSEPGRIGRPSHELFAEYLQSRSLEDDRLLALFDELLEEVYAPGPT